MIFYEKTTAGPEKCFSSRELIKYVEKIIREKKQQELDLTYNSISNYSWLRSRQIANDDLARDEIVHLIPIIHKMSPENCAAVAVKLDSIIMENPNIKLCDVLSAFNTLIIEKDSLDVINKRVHVKKKVNRVHPELTPPGRQPTVSFIVEDYL